MTSPMRFNCKERGKCFNIVKRPKIEAFNDCFPGRIGFGDVDASVEIEGNELKLEFKPDPISLGTGQRLAFERTTYASYTSVILLAGDAKPCPPLVTHIAWYLDGYFRDWQKAAFLDAFEAVKSWAVWAKRNPKLRLKQQVGVKFSPPAITSLLAA
jgi:hypothetical protein